MHQVQTKVPASPRPPSSPAPGSSSRPRSGWPRSPTVPLRCRRAGHRRAADRPRRRPAGPRHGHDLRARRPARPGGRRAADPRAQRDRRGRPRLVGARDRPGALRVRGPVRAGRPAAVAPARPRFWCKTVAVLVGIVLAAAAVLPLPDLVATVAVAVVAVLLAESFLHEAVDRWRAPAAPLVVPLRHRARVPRGLAGARRPDRPRPPDRDRAAAAPARGARGGRPLAGAVAAAAGLARGGVRPAAGACSCWSRCWTWRSTRSSTATSTRSGTGPTSAPASGCSATRSAPAGRGWSRCWPAWPRWRCWSAYRSRCCAWSSVAAGRRRFSLTAATAFVTAWVLCFATGVQAVTAHRSPRPVRRR